MTRSSIFDVLCHLHRQLDVGIWAAGYTPGLGSVIVSLAKQGLETQEVMLDGKVVLPAKKQYRNTVIL